MAGGLMEWKDIKQSLPDDKYDHNEPDRKLFLVTDGAGMVTMAWYVKELKMFGAHGGIYKGVTHWLEAPEAPIVKERPAPIKKPKLMKDWVGLRVKSIKTIANGSYQMPAGTIFSVENTYRGLTLRREPCSHCRVELYVTKVSVNDVEIVEEP